MVRVSEGKGPPAAAVAGEAL
jgi:hypothetical protein